MSEQMSWDAESQSSTYSEEELGSQPPSQNRTDSLLFFVDLARAEVRRENSADLFPNTTGDVYRFVTPQEAEILRTGLFTIAQNDEALFSDDLVSSSLPEQSLDASYGTQQDMDADDEDEYIEQDEDDDEYFEDEGQAMVYANALAEELMAELVDEIYAESCAEGSTTVLFPPPPEERGPLRRLVLGLVLEQMQP
jgi:hypothetical protein